MMLNGMLAAIPSFQGRAKASYVYPHTKIFGMEVNNKFLTEENLRHLWRSSSIKGDLQENSFDIAL